MFLEGILSSLCHSSAEVVEEYEFMSLSLLTIVRDIRHDQNANRETDNRKQFKSLLSKAQILARVQQDSASSHPTASLFDNTNNNRRRSERLWTEAETREPIDTMWDGSSWIGSHRKIERGSWHQRSKRNQ